MLQGPWPWFRNNYTDSTKVLLLELGGKFEVIDFGGAYRYLIAHNCD